MAGAEILFARVMMHVSIICRGAVDPDAVVGNDDWPTFLP